MGDGEAFFEAANKQHLEGIMAKRAASPYRPGVRGDDWLKIKTHLRQEVVIGGLRRHKVCGRKLVGLSGACSGVGGSSEVGWVGGGWIRTQIVQIREYNDD